MERLEGFHIVLANFICVGAGGKYSNSSLRLCVCARMCLCTGICIHIVFVFALVSISFVQDFSRLEAVSLQSLSIFHRCPLEDSIRADAFAVQQLSWSSPSLVYVEIAVFSTNMSFWTRPQKYAFTKDRQVIISKLIDVLSQNL